MPFAIAALAFVVNAATLAPPPTADDRALAYLALKIFVRDADKYLVRGEGLILIDPMSPSLDHFPPSDTEGGCGTLLEFGESLATRNSRPINLGWVPVSSEWRFASPQEVDVPLFRLDPSVARTRLRLLAPAYAEDGKSALVALSFLDGEHGARANLIFERIERGWSEKCVEVEYWP
jgi:hypothetical protein